MRGKNKSALFLTLLTSCLLLFGCSLHATGYTITTGTNGSGTVTVMLNDRTAVFEAVALDKQPIGTGESVEILGLVDENLLLVKRL